jgi:hypothetical protein
MKKVLSFVLILALVLGSFSFAFGLTDVADSANTDAINVSNDLGIIDGYPDGTFLPEKAVNRAEFAKMITRALGVPESALAGFTATSFKDTSGYTWAVKYLAFCESKGIMLGDGMGNAMPGRTISLNEAVTMVLRAVGYTENSGALVGVWPSNYVTLGKDLGLYDDVATMVTVDRANAAQVLYNALTVQKVQVDADGLTTFLWTGGGATAVNMLTSGLDCTQDNNGYAYVLGTAAADTAVMNAQKYVGAFVKTFANSDGDIVAVEAVSTFLKGKYNFADKVFKADGVEYNLATANIDYTWTNGAPPAAPNVLPMSVQNGQSAGTSATLTNAAVVVLGVDVSGKTIKEVYSIATWTQEASFEFEAGMLEDDNLNGYDFTLDDNDAIDKSAFTLVGVNSLEDIAVDDVVTVYLKTPGVATSKIVKVAVGTEKVTGTITKISGTDYTLDGKVYELSTNPIPTVILGESGTASLDYNGDIAFWDLDDASVGNYAMYITSDKAVSFGSNVVKVKLVDKAGTEITPTCKDDAVVYADVAKLDTLSTTTKTAVTKGSIVEFSLDSAGKVKKITSAATTAQLTGTPSKDGSLIGTTPVYAGVVIFLYNSDDEFEIATMADLDTDTNFNTVSHTAILDGGKIKAIAAVKSQVVDQGGYSYGVINVTGHALDMAEDDYLSLEGFMDGVAFDKLTDQTALTGFKTTTAAGLTEFTVNADGVITKFANASATANTDFVAEVGTGVASTVGSISGNVITLHDDKAYIAAAGAVVYLWDDTDAEWTLSRLSALKNKYVKMYTSDKDDVTGFDIILAWE